MDRLFEAIEQIAPVLTDTIRHDEQKGQLAEAVVDALREAGMYQLFLPASLGGREAEPLTVAKLVEKIAHYSAGAAWSVMVTNTSCWIARSLSAEVTEEIYDSSHKTFCAGSFASPLVAVPAEGGFFVKGQVPLCSNVHLARWIGLLSVVMQEGQPLMYNGMPELRAVFLKREDCSIIETWQVLGMKSTDSNDVMVDNKFVPVNRTFILAPYSGLNRHYKGILYRFPVTGILSCSLIAPVALGIASNAIEELKLLTGKVPSGSATPLRGKPGFQKKLGMAEALVRSARIYLHHSLADCWNKMSSGKDPSPEDKAALLLAASHVNLACTNAVDIVYSAAGATGIYLRNNISRYFTDMQVIRQHGFANENRFETAAQMILGLQPDLLPASL